LRLVAIPTAFCPLEALILPVGTDVEQLGSEVITSGEHSIAPQPQSKGLPASRSGYPGLRRARVKWMAQ
jgi:hypothetical protein